MYIVSTMINLGLNEGEEFPTKDHKKVASIIALCNPNVTTRDMLTAIVSAVNKVPKNRIKTIDYPTLVNEFHVPSVGIYGQ